MLYEYDLTDLDERTFDFGCHVDFGGEASHRKEEREERGKKK